MLNGMRTTRIYADDLVPDFFTRRLEQYMFVIRYCSASNDNDSWKEAKHSWLVLPVRKWKGNLGSVEHEHDLPQ